MDKKILEILVCPACKGELQWQPSQQELWCRADKLAYAVREGIPIMLVDEARHLSLEELDATKKTNP